MNERDCQVLDYMMDLTKDNKTGIVNFCLNYGSHAS